MCRFINADSYASTGQGFIGYNMFAYCNNNPINRLDVCGEYSLVETTDYNVFHEALMLWAKLKKDNPPDETVAYGGNITAAWGIATLLGAGIVSDPNGDSAIIITVGFGGGLGASINPFDIIPGGGGTRTTYHNADSVDELKGFGVSIGTTLGFIGGEVSSDGNVTGTSASISPSLGLEFHAVINYTWVIKLN